MYLPEVQYLYYYYLPQRWWCGWSATVRYPRDERYAYCSQYCTVLLTSGRWCCSKASRASERRRGEEHNTHGDGRRSWRARSLLSANTNQIWKLCRIEGGSAPLPVPQLVTATTCDCSNKRAVFSHQNDGGLLGWWPTHFMHRGFTKIDHSIPPWDGGSRAPCPYPSVVRLHSSP